ncbi:DUF4405 domain-containing protein [bacterium]|nr:DUF4405 domain-containing protein [bacterium]
MKIKIVKLILDVGMLLSGLVSFWSGVILWLFLPSGKRSGLVLFWNLTKYQWEFLHLYFSLFFLALIVFHFLLNWKVFKSYFK